MSLRWAHSHFVGFVMSRLMCFSLEIVSTGRSELTVLLCILCISDIFFLHFFSIFDDNILLYFLNKIRNLKHTYIYEYI